MTAPFTLGPGASLLPGVAQMSAGLASATRALYGSALTWRHEPAPALTLSFEAVNAGRASLQVCVRCRGVEYEVQLLDAAVVAGLDLAWVLGLPAALRRAAFVQSTISLWDGLAQQLGSPVDLVDLATPEKTWSAQEALGARLACEAGGCPPGAGAILFRPRDDAQWPALTHALSARRSLSSVSARLEIELTIRCEPIPLSLRELATLEPGDVLLLGSARSRGIGMPVRLAIGSMPLIGFRATRQGRRLRLTEVPGQTSPTHPLSRRPVMDTNTPPALQAQKASLGQTLQAPVRPVPPQEQQGLDAVEVEVHVELGRLSIPLASLRTLAVGQVFETAHAPDSDSLVLWCGGQRLGLGQLVVVGDRIGVRIATLSAAAAIPDSAASGA